MERFNNDKGFTINELVVVIAIIGILFLLVIPKFSGYTEKAKVTTIKSEIKALEFFTDEMLLNKEVPEHWSDSGTLPLGKTYGKKGLIQNNSDFNAGNYKVVDMDEFVGKMSSKLPGYFVTNEIGNVYYVNDKFTSKAGNKIVDYKNFQFYYLRMDDVNIEFLKKYEMVILEPRNANKQQNYLAILRSNGTDTYAYQSVMGVDNPEIISELTDEDYISIDGESPYHPEFGYKYGDIRSKKYRDVLLDRLEKDVISQGYNGVFFDTMDDVNQEIFRNNINPKTGRVIRDELVEEYVKFLSEIKKKYPSLSIIQNRGFEVYLQGGAKYVDAMVFENFRKEDYENSMLKQRLFDILIKEAERNNSIIMAISYENAEENYELAKQINWIYTYYNRANLEHGFQTEEKVYNNEYKLKE